jgi:hypothetical protein
MCKVNTNSWKQHFGQGFCKASECSETNLDLLTWHHRDPSTKLSNPSKLTTKVHALSTCTDGICQHNWDKALAEINKCDLLCITCHRKIHKANTAPDLKSVTKEFWEVFVDVPRQKHHTASRPDK